MPVNFKEQLEIALFQYDAAFHLLNVTFPLVNDPKLLIGVIDNIFKSMDATLQAILLEAKEKKIINNFGPTFLGRIDSFRTNIVFKNKFSLNHLHTIVDLNDILEMHKKSPMEFQRGNKFVISGQDYRLRVISINDTRNFLQEAKDFLDLAQEQLKIK